jgi:hypothetical protein
MGRVDEPEMIDKRPSSPFADPARHPRDPAELEKMGLLRPDEHDGDLDNQALGPLLDPAEVGTPSTEGIRSLHVNGVSIEAGA